MKKMTQTKLLRSLLFLALGLGGACASEVNLAAVPEAAAGCEQPVEALLAPQPPMLPGRHCIACHTENGQADGFNWTAAGTVYANKNSACNSGGLEGVKVEIADSTRKILITLFTNRTGNFYTSEVRDFSNVIVRISKDGVTKEMKTPQPTADCPSCHYPGNLRGAPGRIYLSEEDQ